jgi:tRNA U38,U39,U40 pseudouridine synthase TruA
MIEEQLKKQTKTFDLLSDVRISSRTDAGVHALANTAHFDVTSTHPIGELGDLIKTTVNSDLRRSGHLIR